MIILPSESALINVKGRLREVGQTRIGRKMSEIVEAANKSGMSCDQPNIYIRLCRTN